MTHPTAPAPRELTDEEAEERAQRCYGLEQSIKAGLRAGREALWEVARSLHEFDEESGWSALGYEKLGDWLADPEVSMTRRTYYRLIGTHRELAARKVKPELLPALDVSKVDIVLPAVKAGRVALDDALEDVKELGARDLRDKYLKRPDPAESVPDPGDGANVGTDEDEPYPAPMNDGDDTPQWAGDAQPSEPAHNEDTSPSGQVQEVDDPPEVDVVEGDEDEVKTPEEEDAENERIAHEELIGRLLEEGNKTTNWPAVRTLLKEAAAAIDKLLNG
jgi:hypothetical protein